MVRPTHAVVDLDGLTANYVAIGRHLAAHEAAAPPRIIAVVKANAYGHGSVPVARALEKAAADGLNTSLILACADIKKVWSCDEPVLLLQSWCLVRLV